MRRTVPAIKVTGGDPLVISPRLWAGFTGTVAYDIGSNAGQSFIHLIKSGFTRITAFEPEHRSFRLAQEAAAYHIQRNPGLRIGTMRSAVSDTDGSTDLASMTGTESDATGQLVTIGTNGMEWSPPDWNENNGRWVVHQVPCNTLDTISESMDPPDMVKIDTEGHEWHIVEGANRLLRGRRPALLIEYHTPDNRDNIVARLGAYGYSTEVVHHPHHLPGTERHNQVGWIRAHHPNGTGYERNT